MSETGLNFGPDWLRELSDNNFSKDGNKYDTQYVYLSKPVKYKYEKKEILDLFDSEVKIQPKMKEFAALISDRCQTPLSLKPMTEFEQQAFGKCVNSEFVSRLANKTVNNKNEHNLINSNEIDLASERDRTNERTFKGRGVNTINFTRNTSDRGRGRIRTGLFRNSSYENENEAFSNENRRDFRTKSFDRTEEPSSNRENKPFERQFSKPPPVCVDNNGSDNSRLNFRKDTHQNDTSWRSNRTRTDNTRKNLEWRSKFRSEESNSINSGDWKNNDRWQNENEENIDMNKKRMYIKSRDKNWDDNEDDKRNNLPEWSLNDDAVLDKKFGTFDASGQFREEPVDPKEFKSKDDDLKILKEKLDKQINTNEDKNFKNTNLQLSNCSNFIKDIKKNNPHLEMNDKEKINQNILDMLAENSQSKINDFSSRHEFEPVSRLEKNCDLKSTERDKFQQNFISSLIQRHPLIIDHSSEKVIKPSNDLSIEQSQKNDQTFSHNFINNLSNSQPQPFSQLSQFNKNQQDQDNTNKILDIINDRKSLQKMNSQIKVSNDELKEINLPDKNNDVQSFLESLANSTKTNSQNFSLNNTDVQKILSLAETEKLLKEINKSSFNDLQKQVSKNNQSQQENRNSVFKNIYEENFNDVEKCTDNLVDQWSVGEDSKERFFIDALGQKFTIFPPNHEFGQRWFYKDPQGEVQGPFSSNDMLDWYKGGYFTMDLLVRRGCDEEFSKLGELINTCKGVPFISNENTLPLRNITPQINPMLPNQAALFQMAANQNFGQPIPQSRNQPAITQQQSMFPVMLNQQRAQEKLLIRQMQQRQMMMYDHQLMQNQLRHLLTQLKKTEQFSNLPVHEQQEVLIQHYVQNQHLQMQRNPIQGNIPVISNMAQSSILNQQTPIVNPQTPNVNQQNSIVNPQVSIINPQTSIVNQQASGQQQTKSQHLPEENLNQMLNSMNQLNINPIMKQMIPKNDSNIWLVNGEPVMTVTAIEEMQRQEQERRDFEEKQAKLREEQDQRRNLEEIQLKIDEERKRSEEILRMQEEENRKQEIERMKLEQVKNDEKYMQDKIKKLEEQKRRQDEEMKKKSKEEKELIKKQLKQKQHQQQLLMKQQEKNEQQKQQQQILMRQQQEKHEQQMLHQKDKQEQQKQQSKKKGWAVVQESNYPASLDEIQKLQEIELEERMKNHQLIQMLQESQNPKGWSNVTTKVNPISSFLTLDEIQKEESERLARKKKVEKENTQVVSPQTTGVWGNAANNLNWKTANLNIWGNQNQAKNEFAEINENLSNDQQSPWSIELNGTHPNKKSLNENIVKNNEKVENSAFSLNSNNNNNTTGNKENNGNTKKKNAKKEENSVLNANSLNKNTKSSKATITDEFNKWCHEALSQFQGSIDVPTFISFLKDVESPHDVNDYVFSYLGENKESKEFSKRFIEKRSYYKNQAKKTTNEEVIWGPAPAITPSLNKVNSKVEENEFSIFKSGKRKKKTVKKNENSEEVK